MISTICKPQISANKLSRGSSSIERTMLRPSYECALDGATSLTFANGSQREVLTSRMHQYLKTLERPCPVYAITDVLEALNMAAEALKCKRSVMDRKDQECKDLQVQLQRKITEVQNVNQLREAASLDCEALRREGGLRVRNHLS